MLARIFYTDGARPPRACGAPSTSRGSTTLVKNTPIVVVGSSAIALVSVAALAWSTSGRTRGWASTEALPLIPFLLPPIAGSTAWVLLLAGRGLHHRLAPRRPRLFGIDESTGPLNIYSFPGLLLVYTVYQVPYAFLLITAGLRNVDPALEEASRSAARASCGRSAR